MSGESGTKGTVLVVDDQARIRRLLEMALGDGGYQVFVAGSAEEAEVLLGKEAVDLLLTDLALPGRSGIDLLSDLRARGDEIPVILITAFGTVESAVQAMKLGAFDYVIKPFRTEEIEALVARALKLRQAERENRYFRELTEPSFEGITATSPAMATVIRTIERVAPTSSTVLITGETGVGKELVARALHARSPRKDQLFVPLNCAAIPGDLLEAELFGAVRGAYTGATRDRPGKFELAHGGTLFLDEIGDMPHSMQAKLLRVLQGGVVERLGSNQTRRVDVRVISATHRDLDAMVKAGSFREDLFYRINVVPIHVPSLRERVEDIRPIAAAAVEGHGRRLGRRIRLSEALLRRLETYDWPGNVRELNNILERAALLTDSDLLTDVDLPGPRGRTRPGDGSEGKPPALRKPSAVRWSGRKGEPSVWRWIERETTRPAQPRYSGLASGLCGTRSETSVWVQPTPSPPASSLPATSPGQSLRQERSPLLRESPHQGNRTLPPRGVLVLQELPGQIHEDLLALHPDRIAVHPPGGTSGDVLPARFIFGPVFGALEKPLLLPPLEHGALVRAGEAKGVHGLPRSHQDELSLPVHRHPVGRRDGVAHLIALPAPSGSIDPIQGQRLRT